MIHKASEALAHLTGRALSHTVWTGKQAPTLPSCSLVSAGSLADAPSVIIFQRVDDTAGSALWEGGSGKWLEFGG